MATPIQLWQFTVRDYHRMRESGILTEDDRVELIDGEVREMSPIGVWHASTVRRLIYLLSERLHKLAIVDAQDPIVLDDYTEPQPDLVLLKWQDDFYADHTPRPDDILVVIEVADTTADYDRSEKIPRYAQAGIHESWLVDAATQSVEQHLTPQAGEYQQKAVLRTGDQIICRTIPTLQLAVSEILGDR